MKMSKKLKFGILAFPSLVIAARSWLWIMGIISHIDSDRAILGFFFVMIGVAAALLAFGPESQ